MPDPGSAHERHRGQRRSRPLVSPALRLIGWADHIAPLRPAPLRRDDAPFEHALQQVPNRPLRLDIDANLFRPQARGMVLEQIENLLAQRTAGPAWAAWCAGSGRALGCRTWRRTVCRTPWLCVSDSR